ncbi:MAG: hypothetical protein EOP83_25845 [Verrucomicrobiaceae bacterium]|nr:MAG: hypothetical protein EOP83_25845 [Verrucomicrobiaceae bacterium]
MSKFEYRYVPNSNCWLTHRFVTSEAHHAALAWATERFGPPAPYERGDTSYRRAEPLGRWTTFLDHKMFSFLDPNDAFEFRMRWT